MKELFKKYWPYILGTLIFSVATNGLALWFPKKVGEFIDIFQSQNSLDGTSVVKTLGTIVVLLVITALIQSILSSIAAERIGRELRSKLINKLKDRSFEYIREVTSAKLITILTSDVDSVRLLVSNGLVGMLTAGITLIGAIIFLLTINWHLGLATISVIPFIVLAFGLVFGKLGALFGASQMNLDKINKVINESIVGAPLVRVLNSEGQENQKFNEVNEIGTGIARKIVVYFAGLVPIVSILANIAVLIILYYGGYKVVNGTLTTGQLTAFFSYTSFFLWPIFVLGFSSQFVSKAQVSLKRIDSVLNYVDKDNTSSDKDMQKAPDEFKGHIEFKDVGLKYGEKEILKGISFEIRPDTKTAIVGPTGAGKTELFYLMAGLARPTSGQVLVDGIEINEWDQAIIRENIGMVFQDSIIFQTTFKENILFNSNSEEDLLDKAIKAADLKGLIERLPNGLETNVGERGVTLSGGQKQRIMLARALTLDPSILLLDDFTARVDAGTEERIVKNLAEAFPNLTVVSITQKIEPIKAYDQVIVLMEGEMIGKGTHDELLKNSIDYKQIYESQQSAQ